MKSIIYLLPIFGLIFIIAGCPRKKGPLTPEPPTGPITVIPGVADTFSTVTTDPDEDNIRYRFKQARNDGGQTIYTDWGQLIPSGSTYKAPITFSQKGFYSLSAQAKDEKGKISKESDPTTVVCGLGITRWFFTCPDEGDFNSTPAIDDQGNIYAGCSEGHIHSLNSNGQARWQYANPNADEFIASPVIAPNGTIYACDRNGVIYSFNSNGNLNWSRTAGEEIIATPAVGTNSQVYVNSTDGFLYAINAQGQEIWHKPAGGLSSPAIDSAGNIYVGSEDGYLYAYNSAGDSLWRYDTGAEIISSPAITSDGKICFGNDDGFFYIINPDGSLFKREEIATAISSSPVIGTDGSIYISTDDGTLYKFDLSGNMVTLFATDGGITSSPAVVKLTNILEDVIYFKVTWGKKKQADEDSLYMIKSDGARLAGGAVFQVSSTEELLSSPMVGVNGTIYTGGGVSDEFDPPQGGLFALSGRGTVVNSSWPLFRRDTKNTGRVQ